MDSSTAVSNGSTSPAQSASAGGTDPASSLIAEGQDRFIKLLVAQLQNQDPLSPMDNAQFTTQLAQISTVQGIEKLNAVMSQMLGAITAGQQLQAMDMIGRQALVEGDALSLAGESAGGGFRLDRAADVVTVSILDPAGALVRELDLGAHPAGASTFTWDGKDDAGNAQDAGDYTIQVRAWQGNEPVTATAMALVRITAASAGTEGVTLTVGGRSVALADVGRII
jgi:flagellar basal-body rod modification protein FlgD